MKKPFGKTKVGIILKGVVSAAVDIIPAGESVKKLVQNLAATGNNTDSPTGGNASEVFKIIRAVVIAGLVYAIVTGKIDMETLNNTLDSLSE